MKSILIRLSLAAGLTFAMFALSSAGSQQLQSAPLPLPQTQQSRTAPQSPVSPDAQTPAPSTMAGGNPNDNDDQTQDALAFTGRIQEYNGVTVLVDPVARVTYQFDDQSRVRPLLGRQVKVVGKLQMKSNTIRIDTVELLP
ncbi:MAG TPA: hypothetical protein VMU05_02185 [Dongiaceae bacterium]|nr:hypothetical protein [Dongiaceae bacterium]